MKNRKGGFYVYPEPINFAPNPAITGLAKLTGFFLGGAVSITLIILKTIFQSAAYCLASFGKGLKPRSQTIKSCG